MLPFEEFERRVVECFEAIPEEFRLRVSGPVVLPDTKPHPELDGNFLLAECIHHPDWSGDSPLDSTVFVYYGSFDALAAVDPWFADHLEDEIRETVWHEIQHHLEDAAGAPGLRDLDWAEEENARRMAGMDYAQRFWRAGEVVEDDGRRLRAVGADLFLELVLSRKAWRSARDEGMRLRLQGRRVELVPDDFEESPTEVTFPGHGRTLHGGEPGDLVIEVRRSGGFLAPFGLG